MTTNPTDPMIGRLIDGRYEVQSRIARGGMATVYLATDRRLQRRVAVKVMHGHLADESQYRERFIQEAHSAARLAHPNVVNVYDQGQDDEAAYLVMEYLPGITLRDLLHDHGALTTDQAFDIMDAVLSGLAAAHRNGIVHRDLKPENVLLADDGRIKIGDFGLARAVTASTASGNALLGTIAYLSPELVTRGVADARSDIYAVGIMLYEMLTGVQPFTGDQPFQIAHQHANDTVGIPSAKNPDVPAEFDELVLWATARDPDQRPRDAGVMLDQLLDAQASVISGRSTATTAVQTRVLPTASAAPAWAAQNSGPRGSMAQDSTAQTAIAQTAATRTIDARGRDAPAPVVADNASTLGRLSTRRRGRGWILLVLVLLLAVGAGSVGLYFGSGPGAMVDVPAVAGTDVATATARLTAAELIVADTPTRVFDPVAAVDSVVGSSPSAGVDVGKQTVVTLLVSQGPEPLPVPALAGLAEQEARDLIETSRFRTADSVTQFDPSVEAGHVIRALAADGSELAPDARYGELQPVGLLVSLGPVPTVAGEDLDDAIGQLEEVGLIGEEGPHEYSESVPEGAVLSSAQVGDGPVVTGTTFELTVSDGPAPVAVPDVVGALRDDAVAELEAAGFRVSYNLVFRAPPFSGSTVTSSDPEAGTLVDRGSTITIYLQLNG